MVSSAASQQSILVLTPIGRDAELACQVLEEAGLAGERCEGLGDLCRKLDEGAGAVLLAEEALADATLDRLVQMLDEQPPWSTLPVLVLTRDKSAFSENVAALKTLETRRGVTFLERPLRIMTLISTVQATLEARRRQYQIRDLLQTAEEGMRYRDEFLAMLGHELRNPIAPIRSAIDILKLESPLTASSLQWGLEIIDRQTQQLTYLVNDLLDMARVTQGRIQLRRQTVVLADSVAAAIETARPIIEARRHKLTLTSQASPLQVEADPTRLVQVVANLLQNAAKYTKPEGHIWLTVRREGNEAVICVRDTGIGIPAEFLPHLFTPFSQASRSLARSQGGLGVGLALVRGLVEMHGGRVLAFSAGLGQGSEFVVRLPALAAVRQPTEAAQDSRAGKGEPPARRILVVDDNRQVAESLARLLAIMGHQVHTVYDGAAALDAVHTFHPEVIFLDIGLPGMDGYEVAQHLRTQYQQKVRLVAVTGYGQEEDRRRAHQAGFDDHLVKPVAKEALQDVLALESP